MAGHLGTQNSTRSTTGGNGTGLAPAEGGGPPWLERIERIFDPQHLAEIFLNLSLFIGGILLGILIGRLARDTYHRLHRGVPTSSQLLVGKLLQFVFVLVAFGVSLSAIYGLDPVGLMTALGLVSLALGFGLQNTVANLAAGVGLTMDKPFDVGDRIQVGQTWGDVVSMGLRSTRILTTSGEHVVVPNSVLDTQEVWNYTSRADRRMRLEIAFGISYDSSIALAEHLALQAARGVQGVLAYPEPRVLVRQFANSAVDLELRCWIDRAQDKAPTVDRIMRQIKEQFDKEGVHFPFPQRTISRLEELPRAAPTPEFLEKHVAKRPVMMVCTRSAAAAQELAPRVIDFADQIGARVVVLHVRPAQKAMQQEDALQAVNRYLEEARRRGVPAQGRMEVGELATTLQQVAKETGARLVAFGNSRRPRFGVVAWQRSEVAKARSESPVPVVVLDQDQPPDARLVSFWRDHLAEPAKPPADETPAAGPAATSPAGALVQSSAAAADADAPRERGPQTAHPPTGAADDDKSS
jgi:small-conductance mechanosensitive channel/nucleotide-binding universal stress UspA family protein